MRPPNALALAIAYALAAAFTAAALLLRGLLNPWLGTNVPFSTLYGAIALSVWIGGYRPALFAMVVGYLGADWFFIEPRGAISLLADPEPVRHALGASLYAISCIFIIGFGEAMRRARAREHEERERAARTLESISDSMVAIDRDWRYVFVNAEAARQLGHAASDLLGRRVWDVFPQMVGTETEANLRHAAQARVTTEFEAEDPKTGRHYTNRVYPVPDGGISVYFRDITDQKTSEARMEALLSSIDDHFVCYDHEWRYTYVNDGAVRILGLPKEQLLGRSIWELFPSAVGNQYYQDLHTVARERRVVRSQFYYPPFEKWFENHIYPTPDGVSVFSSDITARKKAELAARSAEDLLRLIVDNAPTVICYVDREYRLRLSNRTFTKWLKDETRDFTGQHLREVLGEVAYERLRPRFERALAGETVTFEERVPVRPDTFIWVQASFVPLVLASGDVEGFAALASDISAYKTAEAVLRETQDVISLAMRGGRMGAWSRDLTTNAVWWSRELEEIFGVAPGGFAGTEAGFFDRVHEEDRACVATAVEHAIRTGEDYIVEFRFQHSSGDWRWMEGRGRATYSADGRPTVLYGIGIDITVRKHTEQELQRLNDELSQASRRKDEFLATLAHELRNPLAPMRNAVQILRRTEPGDHVSREARDIIARQVQQMTRLVDDLLDVSRITLGKIQVVRDRIDLVGALHHAVEAARPLIDAAGHELTLVLPPQPMLIDGDATRLTQVFLNLLNNAAKYTPRGGRIMLSARSEGQSAVVSVRDTGIGIPSDHLPHIFEMFSQVAPALERSQGGLGIGLSLVRGLVTLHGGSVEARSEGSGQGSEFIVRLPLALAGSVGAPNSDDMHDILRPVARRRVLVVDDNRDAADSLGLLLQLSGHEVHTVYDGLQALRAVAAFHPDVVLLDIGLPLLNGYEAARHLRQQPGGDVLTLVALTGWGQEEDKRRATEAGFDHHLTKPVDPGLVEAVLQATNRSRTPRA